MSNLQALKPRIDSTEKTAAITKAMYQIASSKLISTQEAYFKYNAFKQNFDEMFDNIIGQTSKHQFVTAKNQSAHKLYILISADRGLVGSYHQNLFKYFMNDIKSIDRALVHVIAIGKKAYGFATKNQLDVIHQDIISNHDQMSQFTYENHANMMIDGFLNHSFGEVAVFSNHFINNMKQQPIKETLLPINQSNQRDFFEDKYLYEGNRDQIINEVVRIHVQSRIYGLLLNAKLSEFSSRIIAMKSATDNANNALEQLRLKYHQARQHKITNDLLDISNSKL